MERSTFMVDRRGLASRIFPLSILDEAIHRVLIEEVLLVDCARLPDEVAVAGDVDVAGGDEIAVEDLVLRRACSGYLRGALGGVERASEPIRVAGYRER